MSTSSFLNRRGCNGHPFVVYLRQVTYVYLWSIIIFSSPSLLLIADRLVTSFKTCWRNRKGKREKSFITSWTSLSESFGSNNRMRVTLVSVSTFICTSAFLLTRGRFFYTFFFFHLQNDYVDGMDDGRMVFGCGSYLATLPSFSLHLTADWSLMLFFHSSSCRLIFIPFSPSSVVRRSFSFLLCYINAIEGEDNFC